MKRLIVLIGVASGLLLLAAACGGNDDDKSTVSVDLGEWFVTPSSFSVSAGRVTFEATNAGGLAHELIIIKTDLAPGELPVSDGYVEEANLPDAIGKIEDSKLLRDKSVSITLDLEPGNYVLICNNLPAHYSLGMYARFRVN